MNRIACAIAVVCTIVAAPPAPAQAPWRVDAAPILDVSGNSANGSPRFSRVSGATRLQNGNFVIGDADELKLHFFDAKGAPIRSIGREGSGPGEFQHVSWLGRCTGDSLHVWDLQQRRMAVFSPTGTFVRQYRVPSDTSQGSGPTIYLACSSKGTVVYQGEPSAKGMRPTSIQGVVRMTAPIYVSDANGKIRQNLGDHSMGEWTMVGGGSFPRPLGPTTSIAVAGSQVFVGTADSAVIEAYGVDGKVTEIKLGLASRKPTKAQFDQASEFLASLAPKQMRDRALQALSNSPMPTSVPPYTALFGDQDNMLFVQITVPGDPETRLRVVNATGKTLGEVALPAGRTIHEIGHDYILTSYDDKDDIPHLAVYRLHRGS